MVGRHKVTWATSNKQLSLHATNNRGHHCITWTSAIIDLDQQPCGYPIALMSNARAAIYSHTTSNNLSMVVLHNLLCDTPILPSFVDPPREETCIICKQTTSKHDKQLD